MSVLEVKNLRKSFGDIEVLRDISFNLEKGEVLSIIGSSGGGKTTLLRILAGLEEYTGSIEGIDGKRAVMMFQEDRLFEQLSALDNVILGGADKTEAEKWLLKTGLSQQDIKKPELPKVEPKKSDPPKTERTKQEYQKESPKKSEKKKPKSKKNDLKRVVPKKGDLKKNSKSKTSFILFPNISFSLRIAYS